VGYWIDRVSHPHFLTLRVLECLALGFDQFACRDRHVPVVGLVFDGRFVDPLEVADERRETGRIAAHIAREDLFDRIDLCAFAGWCCSALAVRRERRRGLKAAASPGPGPEGRG